MASLGLNRPELVFDEDNLPCLFGGAADYENEFLRLKESADDFGVLPAWWGEQCAELRDMDADDGGPLVEADIFDRMTAEQILLYVTE
jgi:hypothetical protein